MTKVVSILLLIAGIAFAGDKNKKPVPVAGMAQRYVPDMSAEKPYDVNIIGDKNIDLLKVWPGRVNVDPIYWEAVQTVRDEYHMPDTFVPQFVLEIGTPKTGICINMPDECPGYIALQLHKWDRDLFIMGVTQIAIYRMSYEQPMISNLADRTRRKIDAKVTARQLKEENK